jgi:hypothetical protein
MTPTSYPPAVELHLIHRAVCRSRKQGLVCSTCCELAERAERVLAAAAVKVEAA